MGFLVNYWYLFFITYAIITGYKNILPPLQKFLSLIYLSFAAYLKLGYFSVGSPVLGQMPAAGSVSETCFGCSSLLHSFWHYLDCSLFHLYSCPLNCLCQSLCFCCSLFFSALCLSGFCLFLFCFLLLTPCNVICSIKDNVNGRFHCIFITCSNVCIYLHITLHYIYGLPASGHVIYDIFLGNIGHKHDAIRVCIWVYNLT